ncbi:hypothetical protein ScalyP_jg7991, partial [Parmales sp. scaly parma]
PTRNEFDVMAEESALRLKRHETTTFDELRSIVSSVSSRFVELTEISATWETHAKSELEQSKSGLKKGKDGSWRDVDGVVVEARHVVEDKNRTSAKRQIDDLITTLSQRKKLESANLGFYLSDLYGASDGISRDIEELYPMATSAPRRKFSIAGQVQDDLNYDFEVVTKPFSLNFTLASAARENAKTLSKIHDSIISHGLDEVSKIHRDERFTSRNRGSSCTTTTTTTTTDRYGRKTNITISNAASNANKNFHMKESDSNTFEKQVELAMLKGHRRAF